MPTESATVWIMVFECAEGFCLQAIKNTGFVKNAQPSIVQLEIRSSRRLFPCILYAYANFEKPRRSTQKLEPKWKVGKTEDMKIG